MWLDKRKTTVCLYNSLTFSHVDFQLIILVAVLALAKAQEQARPAQYSYSYDVKDPFTGDSKTQVESRSGDEVRGQYSLDDPDGTRRIVDYISDPVNGFRVSINKVPNGQLAVGPGGSYSPYAPASPVAKATFGGSVPSPGESTGASSPSAVSVTPSPVSVSTVAPPVVPAVVPPVVPPVPAVSPYYAPYSRFAAYDPRYAYPYRGYPYAAAAPYNYHPASLYPNSFYRFY